MVDEFLKKVGCSVDVDSESSVDRMRYAFNCLRSLHVSTNKRVLELEIEKAALVNKVQAFEMMKMQWESEKQKQSMVIGQALAVANAKNEEYLRENDQLRQEIRALREKLSDAIAGVENTEE